MLGKSKNALKHKAEPTPAELIPWLETVINQPVKKLQVKLRGNILHVLCESSAVLDREFILLRLVRSLLEEDNIKTQLAQDFPQVYQLYFYSRQPNQKQPDWSAPLYLNRLDRHLEQLVASSQDAQEIKETAAELTQGIGTLDDSASAIVLSNVSLARKGDPDAIARYLSETLSALDIGVDVQVRAMPGKARRSRSVQATRAENRPISVAPGSDLINRIWIFCQAHYSPDPELIAQPTAQRLRDLQLTQFHDAVIVIQVVGEEIPDWRLRVDLTPANEMLQEWARWGDGEAITRLLNQDLEPLSTKITTEIKGSTLHVVCHPLSNGSTDDIATEEIVATISTLLDQIGPQGLHRVLIYGPSSDGVNPDWLKQLDLPAAEHPALAASAKQLVRRGDLPALAYFLTRRLNPDLDRQLTSGGIRVQLLTKNKQLHVMTDGPVCPSRQAVAKPLINYLKKHRLFGINGIRIYGRRSGQKQPAWNYGFDFHAKRRLVPQATPEFSASDTYIEDLVAAPETNVLRPTLTRQDVVTRLQNIGHYTNDIVRQLLLYTQFFTTDDEAQLALTEPILPNFNLAHKRIATVWGLVGLLLTLQTDWVVGQVLNPKQRQAPVVEVVEPTARVEEEAPLSAFEEELAELNWGQSNEEEQFFGQEPLDGHTFSSSAIDDGDLIGSPSQAFVSTAALLANSPYPSFRSQQLDEKLALYDQRITEEGPPDVLILGSSRALRGIDPAALRQSLSAIGYEDVSIFNFGINGSTAQVVDLVVRQILMPYPPPKLILWADGARAFNSGRTDITYNAIAVSEGYQQLQEGTLFPESLTTNTPAPEVSPVWANVTQQINAYYRQLDRKMSRTVGQASATYENRERFKTLIKDGMVATLSPLTNTWSHTETASPDELATSTTETDLIDFDGFLSLSVRFNPATYYQNHARVPGAYDSDYQSFQLEGVQAIALQNLVDFTQAQQLPLVFINTPLTDEYLDPARKSAEQDFQRYMIELASKESGFFYRDLGQLWPGRYDYFSDPSHLNRYGAYQVSNRLAQDPMIPWPQLY